MAQAIGPRDEQQDAAVCLCEPKLGTALLVLCDGVGGKAGGRLAANVTIEVARQLWAERGGNFEHPARDLRALCLLAHDAMNREGRPLGQSPRTTVVALYLRPGRAWWAHSGDSRLYHFRRGRLLTRTLDHSVLQLMVERGLVKPEEMGTHPDQGSLLQALGGDDFVEPAIAHSDVTAEDAFLLCSDGFWERMPQEEMAALLFPKDVNQSPVSALDHAITRALERNGPRGDNVTVALALPATAPALSPAASKGWVVGALAAALFACILLVACTGDGPRAKDGPPAQARNGGARLADHLRLSPGG